MARQKGMLNLSGNIEVLAGAPFDARDIVPTKADLTVASNFPYPYVGMETYVTAEDKKYRYMGGDITDLSNWVEIGSGGGGQTYNDFTGATASTAGAHGLVPAPSAGDEGKVLLGNGTWGNIVMPSVDLSNSSVESDILDTTEKAIGTTTDGYLIYQKVVATGGSVPSGATLLIRVPLLNSTDIIRYTKTTDSPLPAGVKFAGVDENGNVIYKKTFTGTTTNYTGETTVYLGTGLNNIMIGEGGVTLDNWHSYRGDYILNIQVWVDGDYLHVYVDHSVYYNKPFKYTVYFSLAS